MPTDPSNKQTSLEDENRSIRLEFADMLREKYSSDPPKVLHLQWPPPPTFEVFNLAMISLRNHQYGTNDDVVKHLQKGDVSGLLSHREQVKLDEISQDLLSWGRKVILIEGPPGAGKSTLAWHICTKWKERCLFQNFEIVLYIQLRDPAIQSASYLTDLLPGESSAKSEVVSAIQYCGGRGVLLVLDGWDEFPSGLKESSIIASLIRSPADLKMKSSALIITSRPIATLQLRHHISTRIGIVGFLEAEIKQYFKEAIGDKQLVQKLFAHLKERPVVEASCYLPLNAAIVTHLFLAMDHTLPNTVHGVFTSLVKCCIRRHIKRQANSGEHIPEISSFDDLPQCIQKHFNSLCSIAYQGVRYNRVTFAEKYLQSPELPTKLDTLSLMQGVASFTATGESKLYSFFHLLTQELLAAFHISKMQPKEQVKIFNELFEQPRFSAVFRFYSAFTKLETTGIMDTIFRIVASKDKTLIISLFHCLYEAQDVKLCQRVFTQLKELDLTEHLLIPVDCIALGYFMKSVCSNSSEEFKLILSDWHLRTVHARFLGKELSMDCSIDQPTTTGALNLKLILKKTHKSSFIRQVCCSTIISKLDLSHIELSDEEATTLADALETNPNLRVLK